jgi:3-phosphoshikimate 1-carboxyvinyltransferase
MIMESLIYVKKSSLRGETTIPASKSHTIRGIIFGLLADGVSEIKNPLDAQDTRSCVRCCRLLGAEIKTGKAWTISGVGGDLSVPEEPLYVGNSGTTLGNLVAVSSLGKASVTLDGDSSIRARPFFPLLNALSALGAETASRDNLGKCPITVRGPLIGGTAVVEGITSIYVTPFLVACPLADENTLLKVTPPVNEKSYIKMTMNWLDFLNCSYMNRNFTEIEIMGGQYYTSFKRTIPGDASSAAFPICAAAVTSSEVTIKGIDLTDPQGDKAIIEYLRRMGAEIETTEECLIIRPSTLKGTTLDLTDTPDLLPILCVIGCAAEGTTVLQNIEVTRMKETDRVKAMTTELSKMGGTLVEEETELHIRKSTLHGAKVRGYNDHRIVMALAVAGMIAEGTTIIDSAESICVTYPTFVESMQQLGANIKKTQSPEDEENDTSPEEIQKGRTKQNTKR